jgi:hypothetical protein
VPKLSKPASPTRPNRPPRPTTTLPSPPLDCAPLPVVGHKWPEHQPLDPAVVKAALWHAAGNIHRAAALLGTSNARLGAYLRNNPESAEERSRASEMMLDKAEGVVLDALDTPDDAMEAARWLLSNAGKPRGYGKDATPAFSFGAPGTAGQIAIRWNTDPKP